MAFVIDTRGSHELNTDSTQVWADSPDDSDDDFVFIPLKREAVKSSSAQDKGYDLNDTYFDFGEERNKKRKNAPKTTQKAPTVNISKIVEKSVTLQPGGEKLATQPLCTKGKRGKLRERKAERDRTKGANWFNLPAPEVTEDIQNDIETLRMRSALDPKHFYKKNDMKHVPKYFQIGRVVDSAADFYSSRIPKKDRKRTLVDDLLADAHFQRQTKRRYKEIVSERQKTNFKAVREARRKLKKGKTNKRLNP